MGDDYDQGFDDQFNDGLFSTTLHNCRRDRPDMWPKSVSEMRDHTSYGQQGLGRGPSDTAHSEQMAHRASGQEGFRYGKAYQGSHEGFRYGKAYQGRHEGMAPGRDPGLDFYDSASGSMLAFAPRAKEGMLPYRNFFDSATGRWALVNRAGQIVKKEGMLPYRKFFDSAKGRWMLVDRAGREVSPATLLAAQAKAKEGFLPYRKFFDSAKGRWMLVDRAGREVDPSTLK